MNQLEHLKKQLSETQKRLQEAEESEQFLREMLKDSEAKSKKTIEKLEVEIQKLRALLTEHGIPIPNIEEEKSFEEAMKRTEEEMDALTGAMVFKLQGDRLYAQGAFEEAREQYDKAIQQYQEVHQLLLKHKKFNKNQEVDQKRLSQVYYGMATLYSLKEQKASAIQFLKKAIDLNPEYLSKAATDTDFNLIRKSAEFRHLMNAYS